MPKETYGEAYRDTIRIVKETLANIDQVLPGEGHEYQPEELSIIDRGPAIGADGELAIEGPLTDATHEFQRRHITRAIDRMRGNVAAAARDLGLHRSNLYRKMKQLGMGEPAED